MDYEKCLEYIYNLKKFGEREDQLARVEDLMQRLGKPHKEMRSIHVTGTCGKGSTVAMITSILKEAGYTTGMFISPHLSNFTERISINKKKISEDEVVQQVKAIKPVLDAMEKDPTVYHPSFFEVITALMFKYFGEQNVDFAVLEVGMGGRLDATNIVDALISIITNVHLEHTHILGDDIRKIAWEKAGIINENGIVLTGEEKKEALTVLKKKSNMKNANLYEIGNDMRIRKHRESLEGQEITLTCFGHTFENLFLPLLGSHQLTNAALAVGTTKKLDEEYGMSISDEAIREGLKETRWPGRLEIVQKRPLVVLDCAKDPAAARNLKENVPRIFDYKSLILVTSISSDKDIESMLNAFASIADKIIITEHSVMERATDPQKMAQVVEKTKTPYTIKKDVKKAVNHAISSVTGKDMILVTGSVFTVGEAREKWFKEVKY